MKFTIKTLIPFLCILIQGKTQTVTQSQASTSQSNSTSTSVNQTNVNQNATDPVSQVVGQGISQGNQVTITEAQLDEFEGYGTPSFRLAIIGDR